MLQEEPQLPLLNPQAVTGIASEKNRILSRTEEQRNCPPRFQILDLFSKTRHEKILNLFSKTRHENYGHF